MASNLVDKIRGILSGATQQAPKTLNDIGSSLSYPRPQMARAYGRRYQDPKVGQGVQQRLNSIVNNVAYPTFNSLVKQPVETAIKLADPRRQYKTPLSFPKAIFKEGTGPAVGAAVTATGFTNPKLLLQTAGFTGALGALTGGRQGFEKGIGEAPKWAGMSKILWNPGEKIGQVVGPKVISKFQTTTGKTLPLIAKKILPGATAELAQAAGYTGYKKLTGEKTDFKSDLLYGSIMRGGFGGAGALLKGNIDSNIRLSEKDRLISEAYIRVQKAIPILRKKTKTINDEYEQANVEKVIREVHQEIFKVSKKVKKQVSLQDMIDDINDIYNKKVVAKLEASEGFKMGLVDDATGIKGADKPFRFSIPEVDEFKKASNVFSGSGYNPDVSKEQANDIVYGMFRKAYPGIEPPKNPQSVLTAVQKIVNRGGLGMGENPPGIAPIANKESIAAMNKAYAEGNIQQGDQIKRMITEKKPSIENNLLQEARKYKSGEDFVRGKLQKDFQEQIIGGQDLVKEIKDAGLKKTINNDGTVSLFHGTSNENAQKILQSGKFEEMTFFSPLKSKSAFGSEGAEQYVKNKFGNKGQVIEIKVDGRDVSFNSGSGEIEAVKGLVRDTDGIWKNPERVKTKSQLTDIWNKANTKQTIETGLEQATGWAQGDKAKFDMALFKKDAKTVQDMLPKVPEEYRQRFAKEISLLTQKKQIADQVSQGLTPQMRAGIEAQNKAQEMIKSEQGDISTKLAARIGGGSAGSLAGFEIYQDEQGNTKIRYNPVKGAVGAAVGLGTTELALRKFGSTENLVGQGTKGLDLQDIAPSAIQKSQTVKAQAGLGSNLPSGTLSDSISQPNDPVNKIITALKGAKPIRNQQEALYRAERAQRVARVAGVGESIKGEKGYFAQLGQLKGEMPKVEFESIRKQITQKDIDSLFNKVESASMSPFEKVTAKTGLAKLLGAEGGTVPNRSELKLLNEIFPPEFTQAVLNNRSNTQKLFNMAENALNLPRAMMATADLSAPLRQGVFLIGRPKQFVSALKDMFKYATSEKSYQGLQDDIRSRPTYNLMRENKLAITDMSPDLLSREEAFMSNLAERIPGFGKIAKGSNRAYSGFLNKLRADTFDDLVKSAQANGINFKDNPKAVADIAKFVNSATGRGDINATLAKAAPILNATFFSPRLIASRLNLLNPKYYADLDPFVRKEALKSLITFGGTAMTVLGLSKLAGADVGADPRSSDFGKIKIGNTRYDPWGGFQQYIVLASRLLTGQMVSSTSGKEFTLGEGYKPTTRLDIIQRFFENKTSPVASFIIALLKGQTTMGEKFNLPVELVDRFIPIVIQDLYELNREEGTKGIIKGLPAMLGVGVQTYADKIPLATKTPTGKPNITWRQPPSFGEDIINKITGKTISNIPKDQQEKISELHKQDILRDIDLTKAKSIVLQTGEPQTVGDTYVYLDKGIVKTKRISGKSYEKSVQDVLGNTTSPEATNTSYNKLVFLQSNKPYDTIGGKYYIRKTTSDGNPTVDIIDPYFMPKSPTLTGVTELDKKLISKYKGQLTSKGNDIVTLYENGIITYEEAGKQLDALKVLSQKTVTGKARKPKKITIGKLRVYKPKTIRIKLAKVKFPKIKKLKIKGLLSKTKSIKVKV